MAEKETRSREELAALLKAKEKEIEHLKAVIESLEQASALSESDKVVHLKETLAKAKDQIAALREEIDKLSAPPQSYGRVRRVNKDGTVVIFTVGRALKVNLHSAVDISTLTIPIHWMISPADIHITPTSGSDIAFADAGRGANAGVSWERFRAWGKHRVAASRASRRGYRAGCAGLS